MTAPIVAKPRILDVGCGIKKYPGSVGIDRNPASNADVLAWFRARGGKYQTYINDVLRREMQTETKRR